MKLKKIYPKANLVFLITLFLTLSRVNYSFAQSETPAATAITRADLATSFLRFEQAFLSAKLDAEKIIQVNREFDSLTLLFFSRNYPQVLKRLHQLTVSLDPQKTEEDLALLSLTARIYPPIYVRGDGQPTIYVESLYLPEKSYGQLPLVLALKLLSSPNQEKPFIQIPFEVEFVAGQLIKKEIKVNFDPSKLSFGTYEFGIIFKNKFFPIGRWYVVKENLDLIREKNEKWLNELNNKIDQAHLLEAWKTVKARNQLISQSPSLETSTSLVLNLIDLAQAVEGEIKELQQGRNPFKGKAGDFWRILADQDRYIPFRLYAPKKHDPKAKLPLVVAFHGAGGDENMFMEGYGAGLLKKLAEEKGFLLVTPLSYDFVGAKGSILFDRLLDLLQADYEIDSKRIYLLGHSLGAMVVNRLCLERADKIAAAACLCGFQGLGKETVKVPPILVMVAELDPLFSPARIEPLIRQAQEITFPITLKSIPNYGHTLVVAKELPSVVKWLLQFPELNKAQTNRFFSEF